MKRMVAWGLLCASACAWAQPAAVDLMAAVAARPEGERVSATLHFELRSANGESQHRVAQAFRARDGDRDRLALYFSAPSALRGTAFLSWLPPDGSTAAADQWLYLPALRRVRRIPDRERGKAFLGTDLSYDDMNHFAKVNPEDYRFGPAEPLPGQPALWRVTGQLRSEALARELGHVAADWTVDRARALIVEARHLDAQGRPIKQYVYRDLLEIDGAWTARTVEVHNLQTGHRTVLKFENIDSPAKFDPMLLTESGLARGP